ncbi:DUF4260 domain-containing protein [Olivibacter sitiensis]|uniref:DUF4260 domain-containing protein n=1 Tax=Olivibacter sitiensis TaxID=376470 RepID=UPI001FE238D0|nr:DUF4260 domain-containing protein [Olivibacter sitiensis]
MEKKYDMKRLVALEEFCLFICSFLLFLALGYTWWWFFALLLLPDLSMLGYVVNNRVGAISYNLFHHRALALLVGVLGYWAHSDVGVISGIVLFGHSSMDRAFGYGLKYFTGFRYTHLGRIGNDKNEH